MRVLFNRIARRRRGRGKLVDDGVAVEADRLGGLFAARGDPGDKVVCVLGDRATRSRRRLGEAAGDGVAVEADRLGGLFTACAYSGDDLVRVFCDSVARSRRSLGKAPATESPWKRIASAVCSPLALTRATTSSAYSATALRAVRRSLGEPIGDQVAVETDCLGGLFAACAHSGNDPIRILADSVDGRPRGL